MTLRRLPVVALLAAALATGCGGDAPQQRTPPPDAKRVDQSKAGTITGRVLVEGPVPDAGVVKMTDAFCAGENKNGLPIENVVVANGGLNNVFVHIKDGVGNYYFDTPADPVKLDQRSCRYTPHVVGVQVGQPLEISNSDSTAHNVSAVAKSNRAFNFSQPMQGLKNTVTFKSPEVMVPMRCDVHGWMNAYVGVVPHPYFAVTSDGGKFALKNVPAGTYTIEAWHEKFGTQTQNVTIGDNESKELTFTFKAPTTLP
jgi:plastocyanin